MEQSKDKGKRTFKVGEDIVDVPSNNANAFLTDFPDAEEMSSFIVDNDTVDVPISNKNAFLADFPNARPTFDVPEKKNPIAPIRGLGGSSDGSVPSPLSASATTPLQGIRTGLDAVKESTEPELPPKKGLTVPSEPIAGIGGIEKPKDGQWKETQLTSQEEQQYRDFMQNDPNVVAWAEEFKNNYGEYPSIQGGDYDYKGAWKSGQTPKPVDVDGRTEYHWGSIGKMGKELKSPDHPTKWKSDYMQLTGKDPDKEGITNDRGMAVVKAANLANDIVYKSLNPPAETGTYIIDGKKVPREKARQYVDNRSFSQAWLDGEHTVEVEGDDDFKYYAEKQKQSLLDPDWYDSLIAGVFDVKKNAVGLASWANDITSKLTGIPNFMEVVATAATKKNQLGVLKENLAKSFEDIENIENSMFKVNNTITELISKEDWGEVGRLGVNTGLRSAPNSIVMGAVGAVTGGGVLAAGAATSPLFMGGAYADQEKEIADAEKLGMESSLKNLSQFNRMVTRPFLYGGAEAAGQALEFGILKSSGAIMTGALNSIVKKTAATAGEEAAKKVAQEGAKQIWKNIALSVGVNPTIEAFSELGTFAIQELADVALGVSNKTPEQIVKEAKDTFVLGWAAGQAMTLPATGATTLSAANQARKKLLDYTIAFDPQGVDDLNAAAQSFAQRTGQNEETIKENIANREKAVNAVPDNLVEDTEVVDDVQKKQELEEKKRNLDPVFAKPIEEEIAKIDEKLAKVANEPKKEESVSYDNLNKQREIEKIKRRRENDKKQITVSLKSSLNEPDTYEAFVFDSNDEISKIKGVDKNDVISKIDDFYDAQLYDLESKTTTPIEPVINSTPTDEKYASVNNNDGKGTVDLTKQEYLDWKAKNKPVTEQLTTSKTEQNAKEQQSEQMREQGVQEQPQGESDSNMPIVNQTELQDGQTPKEEVVGVEGDVESRRNKQLEIINKTNPAPNNYNTWIRKVEDIKTADEVFEVAKKEGAMYPDFTEEQMQDALDSGEITIYSSNPIENGVFVTPSKMNAQEYAGGKGGKLYSKKVKLEDIAWIDESEGQYAVVEQPQAEPTKEAPKEPVSESELNKKKTIKQLESENKTTLPKVRSEKVFLNESTPLNREETKGVDKVIKDEAESSLPIESISVEQIVPTQKNLTIPNLEKTKGVTNSKEEILLVEKDGKFYVIDGHHRIANQILNGDKTISARVFRDKKPTKPFVESFGTPVEDLNDVSEGVMQTNLDGVDVLFSEVDGNTVKLESIETPEAEREQGKAKKALQKIIDKADELGKTIVLSVVPKDENTSEEVVSKKTGKKYTRKEPVVDDRLINLRKKMKEESLIYADEEIINIDEQISEYQKKLKTESALYAGMTRESIKTLQEAKRLGKKEYKLPLPPPEGMKLVSISGVDYYENDSRKKAKQPTKKTPKTTEEGLRKLYEGFGFVATEGKNMERVPNAEVKETKAQVTPEVKEVVATEQAATREELQKELYKLFDKKDATDVFDVEDMQAVDKEIERVSALLEALPKEEAQITPEQEFTDEEIAIAYAERQDALKEIDSKEYKSRQIHNMFTKIPLHEYLAMGDRKYYKGSEKFFRNLVDKDAPSTQNSIEDMANEMSEAAGIEITEGDIIKYIEDIVADRIKGEDSFGAKELKSKKGAPKKGRKAPTVSRKEKLLAERKALIDKIKSGLNNQGIAFDPKNAANDSRTLLNDLIKWAQIEIELGSITAKEFIDMVIKEKGFDWRGPARRAYTIGLQTMPDVPFKDVKEKVRLLEKAALAEITSAMKKGKREGIKEGEQKEKEKAEKAKEKAKQAAKESKEKAVEKAIEKAKQKYVNIGARIGEAFGNLEGQIAGKAKGIKEAAQMQKWFTQQVNTILEDMIAEAKESNPGFSIAPRQLAAITKKLLSVNLFNENSYAKAVEYMGKVLEDATYADNVSRANKLKKDNTKRLNRNDYGIDDGSMRQALKVNVEDLSIDELSEYLDFLEGISAGPYNKAKNIPLVNKYAEIYREQKSKAQEPLSDKMVLANEARQISRSEAKDEALNEFEYERQSMLEPVSEAYKKDYLFIKSLTNEELSNLSEKQLQELSNAIRNMRDEVGFMSGNAANTVRELQAERLAVKANEISEGRAFKQLVRDIILPLKVSFKGGIEKLTDSEKYKRLISMMPLSRIDSAMKGITGQQIHDAFIQPISTAFSVFTEKINQIESGYDKLYSKVGKSILPWKREQQRQDEMVKISLIAIQKEFEDNPYNEEISSPLSDYIEAIREAAKANEEYAKLADRYIEIYESMLDENGQFDYKKQEELLDKDTYNFYKYAQEINASNAQFVEVSAIRNGENISLRQSYTPISVALMEYSNLSEVQEMADKFTSNENVTPTAKSGNIKKRTRGAKPLYLDYHRNAKRATRSVLLDYYMREPLRVASKAFNKISKDIGMSADSRAFFKGLEANIAQVVKNVFVNEFYDEGLKTLIAETLKKRGYQMALASVPRAGVEFGTNLSHAIINKPKELMEGSQILYKYKGNDEDLRTLAIFSESAQISRMFGKSTSIMAEQGSNTKGSATTYGRVVDQMADSIMSAPDRAVARPLWIGSFSRTFKEASGSELDIQEFINNPKYRQENAAAIAKARNVADANLSQGFASMNPFEGVVASQVTRADGLIDLYDKYMTRFMRYEFQSSVDAINALMGRNEMSKAQGAALLAATIIRMSAYQFAMSYAVDMFYSLIESATGTGDEEDEEKDVVEKISSSLTGAIISMLVFRRLGNWAKAPIAWGIETLNKNFGEEVGLRKGEYDDYKSPVVFSPLAGDIKGSDLDAEKLLPKFMGPYGPMAKTAFRFKDLMVKRGLEDGMGGYVIEPSETSETEIKKINEEIAFRIMPELVMQSIGAPIPRDIRNLIIRDVFKDYKKTAKEGSATQKGEQEDLKKKERKDAIVKETVNSLSVKVKKNPLNPLGLATKANVISAYGGEVNVLNAKKEIGEFPYEEILKKHNIEAIKEMKDKNFKKAFITVNGSGDDYEDSKIFARNYFDGVSPKAISAEHAAIIKKAKTLEYFFNFKKEYNKYRNPK